MLVRVRDGADVSFVKVPHGFNETEQRQIAFRLVTGRRESNGVELEANTLPIYEVEKIGRSIAKAFLLMD